MTRGIPRLINVLCDRLLLGAYGRNKARVDQSMLKQAAGEVLGEPYTFTPSWNWAAFAAAIGILVWAAGWMLGNYSADPVAPSQEGRVATLPEPAAGNESAKEPVPPTASVLSPVAESVEERVAAASGDPRKS